MQPSIVETKIFKGDDADPRLALIGPGLTASAIFEAVTKGVSAKNDAKERPFPIIYPGIAAWAHTVAALRDTLVTGHNWKASETDNFSRTISPDGNHQFIVASGTAHTGLEHGFATTTRKKGKMTKQVVEANWDLFTFANQTPFAAMVEAGLQSQNQDGPSTWYILVHFAKKYVRVEMSIPHAFTDGRVSAWRERIIIPHIELPDYATAIDPHEFGPSGFIDIAVVPGG